MRRHPQWRLPFWMTVVVVLGLLVGAGALYASDRWGGSSDAATVGIPTSIVSGKPVTHQVIRKVRIHVPARVIHRNGKRIVIPGRTITRSRLVTVAGPPTTVVGKPVTVAGPGGTVTVVKSVPGPTTTLPGTTTTLPGTTVSGPTTTVPGPTVFSTVISTIVSTVTVSVSPPPTS
jgi:hypothetical protein